MAGSQIGYEDRFEYMLFIALVAAIIDGIHALLRNIGILGW